MKQANSSCKDRLNCQFGQNFQRQIKDNLIDVSDGAGSDFREIVFIPPTTQVTSPPVTREAVTQNWQQVANVVVKRNVQRRRFLINFDPRRKTKSSKTLEIKQVDLNENTTKGTINQYLTTTDMPIKKTAAPKRTLRNRNRKLKTLNKAKLKSETTAKLKTETTATPSPTTTTELSRLIRRKENPVTINIGGTSIVIPDFDSLHTDVNNVIRKENLDSISNYPAPNIKKNNLQRRNRKKTNTSFNKSKQNANLPQLPRQRLKSMSIQSDKSKELSLKSISPVIPEPDRKTKQKLRYTKKDFDIPVFEIPSTLRPFTVLKSTTAPTKLLDTSPKKSACPDSLEACVDGCVDLDDVYAYSACVVACGDSC